MGRQHPRIETDPLHVRQTHRQRGQLRGQQLQGSARGGDSRDASQRGQHQTLGQQLPRDLPQPRAQRCADRDLPLALHRAAQQQAAHVRAGDEQHSNT